MILRVGQTKSGWGNFTPSAGVGQRAKLWCLQIHISQHLLQTKLAIC
uniref:Chlorophyll a-b binding proteinic n=1 Tax=Rhizophora mucronata TaxID=61149 RepID=A0A2P2JU58_RHIMU